MNSNKLSKVSCVGAAAVAMCAGLSVALADGGNSGPGSGPQTYPLLGVVRDFRAGHPDFNSRAVDVLPQSAGNVARSLGQDGLPVYTAQGVAVTSPAMDAQGRTIAPSLVQAGAVTDFTVSGGRVTSTSPMVAKVTMIGSAITWGGAYDMPVTMRVNTGAQASEPFGAMASPTRGNVNDGAGRRHWVSGVIQPGEAIAVDGASWQRQGSSGSSDSDWSRYMEVNSGRGGQQVVALRNGDRPPAVGGFMGQVSAKDMVGDFLDPDGKIKLAPNQVIYLFELGSDNTSSNAFDMQDLVVLVDLASDASYFDTPGDDDEPECVTIADRPAATNGPDAGGISSPASFSQWFSTVSGENVAMKHAIQMTRDQDGAYVYSSADFHPIDGELYGNQGAAHNRGLTLTIDAAATYRECGRQFVQFAGDGDVWMYVNGSLVMDMGGMHPGGGQTIDLDRLGLSDGQPVRIQMFYAQRATNAAAFSLKTNLVLSTGTSVGAPAVAGLYD